jgi:hypothetical protein
MTITEIKCRIDVLGKIINESLAEIIGLLDEISEESLDESEKID